MKTNYHTHTPRCGHAWGDEREYIEAAIGQKYSVLGFSDHCPWPGLISPRMRMRENQLPGYISTVRNLAQEYKDKIEILCGLECEYFPKDMNWLKETKEQQGLDYLILGNHYDLDERTGMYFGLCKTRDEVRRYLDTTLRAMETGLYDFLAHPDLYLRSYTHFDETCKDVARQICRSAKQLNLPLEFNLLGLRSVTEGHFSGLGYPYLPFWEYAAEEGCLVMMNVDAHEIIHLSESTYYEMGMKQVKEMGLQVIDLLPLKTLQTTAH